MCWASAQSISLPAHRHTTDKSVPLAVNVAGLITASAHHVATYAVQIHFF